MEKLVTVFTPTYNRGYIINNLYESLKRQTDKNFIWLVVDDGSIDETKKIITDYKNQNIIQIEYIFKENGGKMSAHNVAVSNVKTKFFVCVDSDDYVANNMIETILNNTDKILSSDVAGIIAYRGKNEQETITGKKFIKPYTYSSLFKVYESGFTGDTTLIFKTEIIKKFLFPKIDNEKFITEAYVYDKIDISYKYFLLPEIFIICNYLDDGYTKNNDSLYKNNPVGWSMYYNQRALLHKSLIKKINIYSHYVAYAKLGNQKNIIKNASNRFLAFISFPFGLYLFKKYKKIFDK